MWPTPQNWESSERILSQMFSSLLTHSVIMKCNYKCMHSEAGRMERLGFLLYNGKKDRPLPRSKEKLEISKPILSSPDAEWQSEWPLL